MTTEGYSKGQMWGALKKAWTGFRIAKVKNDAEKMKQYSERINALQVQLGLTKTEFKL